MKISDKITSLRKQKGWSQEELAYQLNVTRQAVSKWESGQSLPDTEKIIQLSKIFQVTTDYLLLEDYQQDQIEQNEIDHYLTKEQAISYIRLRKKAAPFVALATSLCIVSPVLLIGLSAISEYSSLRLSEELACGIGLPFLIVCVAIAVILFLHFANQVKSYQYLETEAFICEQGVKEYIKTEKNNFQNRYNQLNIIGTALCILSVLGIFVSMTMSEIFVVFGVCITLIVVSLGVYAFVYGGTVYYAYAKILEEGEYTKKQKAKKSLKSMVSGIYWLIVSAIYFFYTFGPYGNGQGQYSWFIWPIAGVLYAAMMMAFNYVNRK